MARIRIFVTKFRVQDHVKTKLHDKQTLEIRAVWKAVGPPKKNPDGPL